MIKVIAPRLSFDECKSQCEKEFLEALQHRAENGRWAADGWLWDDRIVLTVCPCDSKPPYNCLLRTLRVDFDGKRVVFGPDETHQFATDLDPARSDVIVVEGGTPTELANLAADWLERETRRIIVRKEWIRPGFTRTLWVLADSGEGLVISDSENKGNRPDIGLPDRITEVWP